MTVPRIPWNNLLKQNVPTGRDAGAVIDWELRRSAKNVIQPWLAKVAETPHRMITIIVGQNDTLVFDWDEGAGFAGPATITLDPGVYSLKNVASHVETKQNAVAEGFSWVYDPETRKYSTSYNGTAYSLILRDADGVIDQSVGKTLGFDCSQDKTGALTYTAEFERVSSYGIFDIVSPDNVLRVSSDNITIPVAKYNALSLAQQILAQVQLTKVTRFYDCEFDPATGFKIKRRGGAETFEFSHAATTIEDTIGYDAVNQAPADNVYTVPDHLRIHTQAIIEFGTIDLGTGPTYDLTFYVRNHNMTANGSVIMQYFDGGIWNDFANSSATPDLIILHSTGSTIPQAVPWRLVCIDVDNPAAYLYIGHVFLGPRIELTDGYEHEQLNLSSTDFSAESMSDYGHVAITVKNGLKIITLTFIVSIEERDQLDLLENALSTGPAFMLSAEIDTNQTVRDFFCRLTERINYSPITTIEGAVIENLYRAQVSITECP